MATTLRRHTVDLAVELTSFVGRRRELAQARALLADARLVTLTGVGGVGKTRLALRIADDLRQAFPDGVRLIELSTVEESDRFADHLAAELGQPGEPGESALAAAARFLAGKRVLLVLDNCEHVLDECAALTGSLLAAADGLRVLCTSRQPLGIPGERVFAVPPLAVPDTARRLPPEVLREYEAVNLFVDRTIAIAPEFEVTEANAEVVARVCQQLDGIPLAIELAAARMRAFSVEQILARLGDRYGLLTAGNRIALPRQRTLRALIDWSFGLCSAAERTLWERLSVFAGGFDLASMEAVCGDGFTADELFELVAGLVEKSVVLRTDAGGRVRYRMLETIRQYGRDRLIETGEEALLRRRHRDWCLWLVAESERAWDAPDQGDWSERMMLENANLRVAVDYSLTEMGESQAALVLTSSLCGRRHTCGSLGEGRRWLDRVLAVATEPTTARARALWVNAWLALMQGDPGTAAGLLRECRDLARVIGDPSALAYATQLTGLLELFNGRLAAAVPLLETARAAHDELDDRNGSQLAYGQTTMAHCFAGSPEAAEHIAACEAVLHPVRSPRAFGYVLWYRGVERWRAGDHRASAAANLAALRLEHAQQDSWLTMLCLEVLAWAAPDERHCARLLGAAESVRAALGSTLAGLPYLAVPHGNRERALRAALGDPAFDTEYHTGTGLEKDEAVAFALRHPPSAAPDPRAPDPGAPDLGAPDPSGTDAGNPLTQRERQIAELVAQGLSNREIAARLVIAQRTAESHVEHILSKLGFGKRAQIAAWIATRRLPSPRRVVAPAGESARSRATTA